MPVLLGIKVSSKDAVAYWRAGIIPLAISEKVAEALNKIPEKTRKRVRDDRLFEILQQNRKNKAAKAANKAAA